MAVVPVLLTRMVAVKPAFHSLLIRYWHLLPAILLDELDATELDFELDDETTELLLDLTLELDDEAIELLIELLDFTLEREDELKLPTIP